MCVWCVRVCKVSVRSHNKVFDVRILNIHKIEWKYNGICVLLPLSPSPDCVTNIYQLCEFTWNLKMLEINIYVKRNSGDKN